MSHDNPKPGSAKPKRDIGALTNEEWLAEYDAAGGASRAALLQSNRSLIRKLNGMRRHKAFNPYAGYNLVLTSGEVGELLHGYSHHRGPLPDVSDPV